MDMLPAAICALTETVHYLTNIMEEASMSGGKDYLLSMSSTKEKNI